MRLPELPGYSYEAILSEDAFGWMLVALSAGGKRRAVRVYKAQATNERQLRSWWRTLAGWDGIPAEVVRPLDRVAATPSGLAACASSFYGWKAGGSWQTSSLDRLLASLAAPQRFDLLLELAGVLGALHEAGHFHGGVRPSCVFLSGDGEGRPHVRLAGFGEAFAGGLQFLEAGDYLFHAAPEQLATGDGGEGGGFSWDVYAFGTIAFLLLADRLPRLESSRRHLAENPGWLEGVPAMTCGEVAEAVRYFLSEIESEECLAWPAAPADGRERAVRRIVESCLVLDPSARPASMAEVAESLREAATATSTARAAATPCDAPSAASHPVAAAPYAAEEKPSQGREIDVRASDPPAASVPEPAATAAVFAEVPAERSFSLPRLFAEAKVNPLVRWQLLGTGALVAILPLTGIALFAVLWARDAEKRAAVETAEFQAELQAELQEKVNRQAESFRRNLSREKQKAEELESVLNDLESDQDNLLGQAKLARQILRETQENGDRFFRLVLENRDSDVPEFRAARAEALAAGRRHYERLVDAYGDAPDFIASTADALFFLGRIYRETGEFGESLAAFGEAERRYAALLEDDRTAKVDYVKNIAVSKTALGELSIRSGQYAVARHYFTESSRFWTEARSREPSLADEAALSIHANSLDIVECEFAMDRADAALDAAMSVGVRLTEMQKADPDNHRVLGTLARSFAVVGRVLESRGESEMAREAYQQAADLYGRAVRLDASVDGYRLGLGNSLARVGLLAGDKGKLEHAAEVLVRAAAANPYETDYIKTLADIYGVLAVAQRDGGRIKDAISLEEKAIGVLRPIVDGNRSVAPDVRHAYSQRLAHLAELLGDSGKFDESRAPLRAAIAILEEISSGGGATADYRRSLARARGLAGFASLKSGDRAGAKEHLELARAEWQTYVEAHPADADAAQAVKWTSEQLRKLQ